MAALFKAVSLNNVNKLYSPMDSSDKFIPLMYTEGDTYKYMVQEGDSLLGIALNNDLMLQRANGFK